ncbi:MAG: endonuclease [Phyllobacteriaceae bacterium]|nr:endonuclease [Phyllobacteriaceae bacterium]MBA91209.1 endonuclease [Phyllobacteriaceae bacterium]
MSLRIATFNIENLMNRFDFSGYRNNLNQDRTLSLYKIEDEEQYKRLEAARTIAHADDTRQLSALAIADTHADIVVLQEVDNLDALHAFEYGYLFKMVGSGYRHKYLAPGNDGRGIDVAVMMRDETRDGQPIEFLAMQSHAHVTFGELGLHDRVLADMGIEAHERVFRRDCLEIDLSVAGRPLTIFAIHFKSMGGNRDGIPGREYTMPVRMAEARAVRRIISDKFEGRTAGKRWLIAGDFNDYRERILISGDRRSGYSFKPVVEASSSLDVLLDDGFSVDPVQRLDAMERWTLYHTRGPEERHLCQLDYLLLSPRLAERNAKRLPEIIRAGQPWRTIFPVGQEPERYPRTGWDRPKASDHCPVVMKLDIA